MGFYINPQNEIKEEWLSRQGEITKETKSYKDIPTDKCLICLVDNGSFYAAAVIFSQEELNCWFMQGDDRSKQWFLANRHEVTKVSKIKLQDFK